MPTVWHQKNPYRVGDIVTYVHWNGAREGVLWRIAQVKGSQIHIDPVFTATGPSKLNRRLVMYHAVHAADLVQLASARAQLDNIINDLVRHRSSDAGEDEEG